MRKLEGVFGTAKADFLSRARKFSFAAFAAFLVFTVFWFIPKPNNGSFSALVIDPDRILQGSDPSWMPMSAAMCGGMLLCLLGFVFVKNAVQRDIDLGVFPFLQASPLKRSAYVFGKFLSDSLLLLLLFGVIMAASFLTMEISFPGRLISPYAFFTPFLCVVPGLLFVAALAVLTDCAPGFRKSSGFSTAVFLCFGIFILTLGCFNINPYRIPSVLDMSGFLWMRDSISDAAKAVTGQSVNEINLLTPSRANGANLKALAFGGLTPSASYLADKLMLIAVSLLLVFAASLMLPISQKASAASGQRPADKAKTVPERIPSYSLGLTRCEASILLGDMPAFWWIAAACFWIANWFSPMDTVQSSLFALAFVWMLPVFSKMGCLEHQTGVLPVLRTIPGAPVQQALSCWCTGLAVSLITGLPVLLRLLFSSNPVNFISALVFTFLIPSAALFFGEWTKTNRVFEVFFLVLCFSMINIPQIVFPGHFFSYAAILRILGAIAVFVAMLFLTFAKRLSSRSRAA